MPVLNRIADLAPTVAEWRRDIHAPPPRGVATHPHSALVADKLRGFGRRGGHRPRPHRRRRGDPRPR